MSFIRTGLREIVLKVRRQRTRFALRHERRLLQRSEIALGREGTSQAANFPELRNEIVALKKLEQEQKEVALRIEQIEEGIRKIEGEREQNTRELNDAVAKLEADKKPVLHARNQAKNASDLCDRELAAVERRVAENDAADRDLMKQLETLQAATPPPDDLEAELANIGARRARLPEERAELVRARLGSADAVRLAKEKLAAAEAELAAVEKQIDQIRNEFGARERALNDNIRTQQDALKDARAHHQVVEERKNPAYLNIGRHLASQGIAPPNAPELLTHVQRHRTAVDRHLEHTAELALLSSKIDKQELRKFYFSIFSVVALGLITLFLFFQSPKQREWLPQETDTILSINNTELDRDDLSKKWRKDQPDAWTKVWSGLLSSAAQTPGLNVARDATRVTRGLTTDNAGKTREFILVEVRGDLSHAMAAIDRDKGFDRHSISGLAIWETPALAVSRVGPATLAVGASSEVSELVRVRLGIESDLKITGQLFDQFQALDRESALRLISRNPPDLARVFPSIFTPDLLNASQLFGVALSFQTPIKARLLLKTRTAGGAAELERNLTNDPKRWLRLQDSDLLLYSEPPKVQRQGTDLDLRFNMPEQSARVLLERIAKIPEPGVAAAR